MRGTLFVALLLLPLAANAQDRRGVSLNSTLPATCAPGEGVIVPTGGSKGIYQCSSSDVWTLLDDMVDGEGGGGGVPTDGIILIKSGTCPTGFEEDADLNGKTIIGTTAAAGDVGTTGGSDTITDVIDHTHTVDITDPGHVHVENTNSSASGGLRGSTPDTSTNNSTASGYSTEPATTGITAATQNPSGGVASIDNRSAFIKVIACRKT